MGALYKGLSAGLLRQATYTTARMGLFNQFSATLKDLNGGKVSLQGAHLRQEACHWRGCCGKVHPRLPVM